MAKGYIFDKFFNRKIEGETNLASSEELSKKVSKIEVSNIQSLTDAQLNELKVGDVVQKITGQQKHCYTVTYKQEQHGICLSYFDAGYLETVSYDYTAGHWVYNSTDVSNINDISDKLNSVGATQGQVLTSNGDGTSAWEDASGGGEEFTTIDISNKIGNNLEATANSYAKIKYSDNMLYLVISGQYKCLSSLTDSAINFMNSQDLGLPDEVLEKIYRADGTNLSVQASAGTNVADLICSTNFVIERPSNIRLSGGVEISSYRAKQITMVLTKATIVANEVIALDLRLFMTL